MPKDPQESPELASLRAHLENHKAVTNRRLEDQKKIEKQIADLLEKSQTKPK